VGKGIGLSPMRWLLDVGGGMAVGFNELLGVRLGLMFCWWLDWSVGRGGCGLGGAERGV